MGLFEQFPYQNFHELNLDWLIQQINLVKESVVLSVNGQTGDVILYPEAFVRLPDLADTTTWSFYRYADNKAEGVQFINGQPMQRIDDLNRYDIYDSGNPPPYPVTAVNGQTGDVVIAVPVQSVNGMTGNIILYQNASIEFPAINTESWEMWRETPTNQAIGVKFANGQPMKRVDNGLEYTVYDSQNPPPYPVESVAGLTGAVAILNTQIVTDQGQQKIQIVFPVNSVDGQTGSVNTWGYTNNATTKLPIAAPADLWNLTRDINSGTVGLRFTYDSINGSQAFLTFNDGVNPESALRLLTPDDIPSSTGVVSINGQAGVVTLYADNIQMSSSDNTLVENAINNNTQAIAALTTDTNSQIANADNAPLGLSSYGPNTVNSPGGYGSIHYWTVDNWKYQLASETYGHIYIRQNINNGGWNAWQEVVTRFKTLDVNTYSTFASIYAALDVDPALIGTGSIGNQETTSLKSILPNPTGFANYTSVSIKKIGVHTMIATARQLYGQKIAICYIAFGDTGNWYRTDWEIKNTAS